MDNESTELWSRTGLGKSYCILPFMLSYYYFLKGTQKETVKTSKTAGSRSDAIKNFFIVSKPVFSFYNVRCFLFF